MNENKLQEAAYQVNDASLLHLRETENGCQYEAFDIASRERLGSGVIAKEDIADSPARSSLAAFREKAMDKLGMDGGKIAPVSVNMLGDYMKSNVYRRKLFEPETLPKDDIRFVNSRYQEQFRIPDGGCIKVEYPDRQFSVKCERIDDYHLYAGNEVFHIAQFAELMERNNGKIQPEPESAATEMGWRLGSSRYLTVKSCEDGWQFNVYDDKFKETASGVLDKPQIPINEARNEIMASQKMSGRSMTVLGYGFITEKAGEKAAQAEKQTEKRESVLGQLSALKSGTKEHKAPAPSKNREASL